MNFKSSKILADCHPVSSVPLTVNFPRGFNMRAHEIMTLSHEIVWW